MGKRRGPQARHGGTLRRGSGEELGSPKTYTVKAGDTLSGIAKKFGTTYQAIANANGIGDPNKIYPGQVLAI